MLEQGQVKVTLDVQLNLELHRPDWQHRSHGLNQMTGLFSATVELDNPDGSSSRRYVRHGHHCQTEDVIVVPERAVFTAEGESAVCVVKDDVNMVPVEVGMQADSFVEIKSGLAAGDSNCSGGREFVTDQTWSGWWNGDLIMEIS